MANPSRYELEHLINEKSKNYTTSWGFESYCFNIYQWSKTLDLLLNNQKLVHDKSGTGFTGNSDSSSWESD